MSDEIKKKLLRRHYLFIVLYIALTAYHLFTYITNRNSGIVFLLIMIMIGLFLLVLNKFQMDEIRGSKLVLEDDYFYKTNPNRKLKYSKIKKLYIYKYKGEVVAFKLDSRFSNKNYQYEAMEFLVKRIQSNLVETCVVEEIDVHVNIYSIHYQVFYYTLIFILYYFMLLNL
jgi:hypothetical protein